MQIAAELQEVTLLGPKWLGYVTVVQFSPSLEASDSSSRLTLTGSILAADMTSSYARLKSLLARLKAWIAAPSWTHGASAFDGGDSGCSLFPRMVPCGVACSIGGASCAW